MKVETCACDGASRIDHVLSHCTQTDLRRGWFDGDPVGIEDVYRGRSGREYRL